MRVEDARFVNGPRMLAAERAGRANRAARTAKAIPAANQLT